MSQSATPHVEEIKQSATTAKAAPRSKVTGKQTEHRPHAYARCMPMHGHSWACCVYHRFWSFRKGVLILTVYPQKLRTTLRRSALSTERLQLQRAHMSLLTPCALLLCACCFFLFAAACNFALAAWSCNCACTPKARPCLLRTLPLAVIAGKCPYLNQANYQVSHCHKNTRLVIWTCL